MSTLHRPVKIVVSESVWEDSNTELSDLMGTVHAKEMVQHPYDDFAGPPQKTREVDLKIIPAKVERVHISGLGRTKNEMVSKEVQAVLKAENFQDMIQKSHEARMKLENLGLFKKVGIFIDTSKGPDAREDGYEITYNVQETRRIVGGVNTLVGTNEGSVMFGIKMPNLFGMGERLAMEYTRGTKSATGYNLLYVKPINGDPNVQISVGGYKHSGEYPWSGYQETARGVMLDLTFPSLLGAHSIKVEGVWRELGSLGKNTAFKVREQAGHSVKTSLKHVYQRDRRDDPIIPTNGSLIRLTQELAGLAGDVEFIKQEVELMASKTLFWDTAIQFSLAGGLMKSTNPDKPARIQDRFFIGGPLTLRGFNLKGVGPHSENNALGADCYWQGGVHIYSPLPFRPGKGGFGDLFRSHFFINAGNLSNFNFGGDMKDNLWQLAETLRWSYGAGVILKMGRIARLELNYCWPMRVQKGDSTNPGLQFGIGVSFL